MIGIGRIGRSALGVSFFAAIVACSGGIAPVDGGSSGTSSGGSSGTSSGGSSGASSGGSSSGDTTCTVAQVPVSRACVPGTATAGTQIAIQAETDFTTCLGCGLTLNPCNVQVVGQKISIRLDSTSCSLPLGTACPTICGAPVTECMIPPLAAGTYAIELTGGARSSYDIPRQLVVKEGSGVNACGVSHDTPLPLDPSGFPDTCNADEDCTLVTGGNQCQICACPNEAIATSGLEAFESAQRALRSQCKVERGGPSCAACAPQKARCSSNKCVAVRE